MPKHEVTDGVLRYLEERSPADATVDLEIPSRETWDAVQAALAQIDFTPEWFSVS